MKMRKILSLLLVVVLAALCFSGCQKEENKEENKKELKVATNAEFPPFESIDKSTGNYIGFDMDLIRLIGEKLDMTVKIESMEFESVVGSLPAGTHDVAISGLTITPKRQKSVDFSDPYHETAQILIVRKDDTQFTGTDKATLDEQLKNQKIGVCIGFTGEKYANGDAELEYTAIEGAQVTSYDNVALAIEQLKSRVIDVIIMDDAVAKNVAASDANKDAVKVIDVALTTEFYAIAIKKGDTELKDKINQAFKEIKDSGQLDQLKTTWKLDELNS